MEVIKSRWSGICDRFEKVFNKTGWDSPGELVEAVGEISEYLKEKGCNWRIKASEKDKGSVTVSLLIPTQMKEEVVSQLGATGVNLPDQVWFETVKLWSLAGQGASMVILDLELIERHIQEVELLVYKSRDWEERHTQMLFGSGEGDRVTA